ncbi:GntR family transcriptional regulator [Spirochaeta thermophila]|uniref:Transcriptional regulatory protein n=1 Tax=Winmispira thermophila (strain ATCC 49972 / DSM 6192 / RI 19.B1) TaxID=665571 RepID=E0RQP9_WINT6|nr:GntR family transcriptional regulator [Spirochaeta thermophila]ADN01553.1 transcriptional regulatory protein [Spirochaeta thermophila DSM 6192]
MSTRRRPPRERASDRAYRTIKQAIMEGKLPCGTRLSKRGMAEFCGVSVIPVVEALNRLESEGLVESHPYYGSRVIVPNEEQLADMYILREAVEAQAVRILCYTIGIDEIEALRKTAAYVDSLAGKAHEDTDFDEAHYSFHFELVKLTRSTLLLESLERIHLFTLLVKSEEKYQEVPLIKEYSHLDVVNAIARRDPDEAARTMRRHIYRSYLVSPPLWAELDPPER